MKNHVPPGTFGNSLSLFMEIVPIELFGVSIEVPFPRPLGVSQANLDEFAATLCDPATGLGLRTDQIRLRRSDELFNYELTAQFFGENGSLVRTADRVKISVRNARTAADWNLIHQTLVRFYSLMDFPDSTLSTLSAHAHARFPSAGDRMAFLHQFAQKFDVVRPAGLGYVRIADWEKDVRVLIEQSNIVQDAAFLAWDTQFSHPQDWDTFIAIIPTVLEYTANVFGIGFEPFRQSV